MKTAVELVEQQYAFSQRRACSLLMVAVSSVRYQARSSEEDLRARLVELAREKPRFGYRRLQVLLRRFGELVNHKRVNRVYREAGLMLRRKKRKHCARLSALLRQYTARQPGVGAGCCARCDCGWRSDHRAECRRCI
jgi:putative transposase